jgi:hypothetical protein
VFKVVKSVEMYVVSFVLTKEILGIEERQRRVNTVISFRSFVCLWWLLFSVGCVLSPLELTDLRIHNAVLVGNRAG